MRPTIEEYKTYIRELKLRMKQLAIKNKELSKLVAQSRVTNFFGSKKPEVSVENLIKAQKNVIFIQKNIRGFLARKEFQSKISSILHKTAETTDHNHQNRSQGKSHLPSEMLVNERTMKRLEEAVTKRNMTPEMLFRMVDEEQTNSIQTYKFALFLKSLGLKLKNSEINRIGYILDEECLGVVSRRDYLLSLSAFGIAKESTTNDKLFGQQFGGRTLGQILLIKFGALLVNNDVNARKFVSLAMGDQNVSVFQ